MPTVTIAVPTWYETYLARPHWQEVRRRALNRAGHRCQLCNGDDTLNVHHRTYDRIGAEDDADLTVLCRTCHAEFHEKIQIPRSDSGAYKTEFIADAAFVDASSCNDAEGRPCVLLTFDLYPLSFSGERITCRVSESMYSGSHLRSVIEALLGRRCYDAEAVDVGLLIGRVGRFEFTTYRSGFPAKVRAWHG